MYSRVIRPRSLFRARVLASRRCSRRVQPPRVAGVLRSVAAVCAVRRLRDHDSFQVYRQSRAGAGKARDASAQPVRVSGHGTARVDPRCRPECAAVRALRRARHDGAGIRRALPPHRDGDPARRSPERVRGNAAAVHGRPHYVGQRSRRRHGGHTDRRRCIRRPGTRLPRRPDAASRARVFERKALVYPLLVFVAVVCVAEWHPFDVTLDVSSVWGKVKSFRAHPWDTGPITDEVLEWLRFAAVGGAAALWLRICKVRWPRGLAAAAGVVLACGLETSQFFIESRGPDLRDAVVHGFGAIVGAALVGPSQRLRPAVVTTLVYLVTVIGAAIQELSPFAVATSRNPVEWIPFLSYYQYTSTVTISHVLEHAPDVPAFRIRAVLERRARAGLAPGGGRRGGRAHPTRVRARVHQRTVSRRRGRGRLRGRRARRGLARVHRLGTIQRGGRA